ncbi:MAG: glycosyltransferase [Patescibacteria group bacterium]
MTKYLSIVLPAYNEVKNLRRGVLSSVNDFLKNKKFSWEVLVVDDGSTDETVQMAEEFAKAHEGFSVLKEPHGGKAATVIAGMLQAKGEVILFSDMDQSTPIDQIEKLLPKFKFGYDVAIGSRNGRPGQTYIRKLMAYGWIFLRTLILRLPYKDTQCGFKAFKKSAAEKIFSRMQVFTQALDRGSEFSSPAVNAGFDLEVLYIARKLKLRVAEVPVEWYEYGEREEVSPIKDSLEGLRDLFKVRINALMGKYKQ